MTRTSLKRKAPRPNCTCEVCGAEFYARPYRIRAGLARYCSVACKVRAVPPPSGPDHYAWRGEDAAPATKQWRAQRLLRNLPPCEECGRPGHDRVFRDGDSANLTVSNILVLCRRCRMERDGHMDRFRAATKDWARERTIPPAECPECGRIRKLLTSGSCHACTERKRREWRDGIKGQACAACGSHVNVQAHHVIARAELRDRGLLHLMWDTRNRLPLCAEPAPNRCHNRHTWAIKRVPLAILPEAAWEFARELGLEWYLERFYAVELVA